MKIHYPEKKERVQKMNKAVPDNYKVSSEEKELLKKHLCKLCEIQLDSLEIKDLVDIMHKFCYYYWSGREERGATALEAQIKTLRHMKIDDKDYVECMNRAKLYSYPYYTNCSNDRCVKELYPLGNGCKEWLKA